MTDTHPAAPPITTGPGRWRTRASTLFPALPNHPTHHPAITCAALITATAVSLARQPGPGALTTVWDEDAAVFLTDAATKTPWDAITTAYQGYYHLAPRLLAEAAALAPPTHAAAAIAALAAASTAALAAFVWFAAAAHLPHPAARAFAAAPVVVLPLGQLELPNAICNLHWPLLYACVWALLTNPHRTALNIAAAAVVVLTAGSDPLTIALIPLAALRAWTLRGRAPILAALLCGLVTAQLAGHLLGANTRSLAEPRFDPAWALTSYLLRVVPHTVLGEPSFPAETSTPRYVILAATAWLLAATALGVAWRRATTTARLHATTLLTLSVALYTLTVMAGGLALPRYAAAPAMLAIAAAAVLLQPAAHRPAHRLNGHRRTLPTYALILGFTAATLLHLRVDNPRAAGPHWPTEITAARARCASLPTAAFTDVPVSPPTRPPARLPCTWMLR